MCVIVCNVLCWWWCGDVLLYVLYTELYILFYVLYTELYILFYVFYTELYILLYILYTELRAFRFLVKNIQVLSFYLKCALAVQISKRILIDILLIY